MCQNNHITRQEFTGQFCKTADQVKVWLGLDKIPWLRLGINNRNRANKTNIVTGEKN